MVFLLPRRGPNPAHACPFPCPRARYYGQLLGLVQHFPLATDEPAAAGAPAPIKIPFVWADLYEAGGMFGKKKVAHNNITYEKMCVLFNIGALQSQIAAAQKMDFEDGVKAAAVHYQAAACTFTQLALLVQKECKAPPSNDLQPALLNALAALMLAQVAPPPCRGPWRHPG